MLTAFFLTDKFNGKVVNRSNYAAVPAKDGNYVENVSDPRPRVRWITGADDFAQGKNLNVFTVDASNRYIEISSTPSGSITTYDIPYGLYSPVDLAAQITTKLQASGPYTAWICSYTSSGRFKFQRVGSGVVYFRWKTGTHGSDGTGTSLAKELGFDDSADQAGIVMATPTSTTTTALAYEMRFDTTTMILFDKGNTDSDLYAWLCLWHGGELFGYGRSCYLYLYSNLHHSISLLVPNHPNQYVQ